MNLVQEFGCPNCGRTKHLAGYQKAIHKCPKLYGLIAPLIPVGLSAKVEAREREDYVGAEKVQTDDRGRPVMAVITTRDNGQDAMVFAPTAVGRMSDVT